MKYKRTPTKRELYLLNKTKQNKLTKSLINFEINSYKYTINLDNLSLQYITYLALFFILAVNIVLCKFFTLKITLSLVILVISILLISKIKTKIKNNSIIIEKLKNKLNK